MWQSSFARDILAWFGELELALSCRYLSRNNFSGRGMVSVEKLSIDRAQLSLALGVTEAELPMRLDALDILSFPKSSRRGDEQWLIQELLDWAVEEQRRITSFVSAIASACERSSVN